MTQKLHELFSKAYTQSKHPSLWLSLAVDYQIEKPGDKPKELPNLKYIIQVGDSLTVPISKVIPNELINRYREKKDDYMETHDGEKKRQLESDINGLKNQIIRSGLIKNRSTKSLEGFDWAVEFAEVFAEGGFDIVLANPPYVRNGKIDRDLKQKLKEIYSSIYTGTSDLYCFFYVRALQLLKSGGMLVFISSNKWFRAQYGEKLRKHIADNCHVQSITDFGSLKIFENVTVSVIIFVAQNRRQVSQSTILTKVQSLDTPYPNILRIIQEQGETLPANAINGSKWILTDASSANRIKKMEEVGIPLIDYVDKKMYAGISTGFDDAFIIDGNKRAQLIAQDPRSAEVIKPLVVGRDVRKWKIDSQDKWLIFTRRGIDINAYPAIKSHLNQYREKLMQRASGSYKWYEITGSPGDTERFEKAKIIFPEIAKESRFTFDTKGLFTNKKAFIIPITDFYLLGVMNSSSVWEYLKSNCAVLGDADEGGDFN